MKKKVNINSSGSDSSSVDQDSAFEIIEMAIDDINVLTRAFDVINAICEELSETQDTGALATKSGIPDRLMH